MAAQPTTPLLPGKLETAVSEPHGRPHIKITISGYVVQTLVDSGACLSVMQLSTFNAWASAMNKSVQLTPAAPLQSVTGELLDVMGSAAIQIDGMSTPITVTVV